MLGILSFTVMGSQDEQIKRNAEQMMKPIEKEGNRLTVRVEKGVMT
jgi:hypothetical protein